MFLSPPNCLTNSTSSRSSVSISENTWLARCAEASTPPSPGTTSPDFSSSLARLVLYSCALSLFSVFCGAIGCSLFYMYDVVFVTSTGLWFIPISGPDQSRLPRHYQSRSSCHPKRHIKSGSCGVKFGQVRVAQ